MSREESSKQELILLFRERAKRCKTDNEKIEFFNTSQQAFFIDSTEFSDSSLPIKGIIPKDLDDAFYVYANMKRLSEMELRDLQNLPWIKYPNVLKIFLFDFCIKNADTFSMH